MELVLHIMEYIPNKLELSILAKIPMEYYIGVTCIYWKVNQMMHTKRNNRIPAKITYER